MSRQISVNITVKLENDLIYPNATEKITACIRNALTRDKEIGRIITEANLPLVITTDIVSMTSNRREIVRNYPTIVASRKRPMIDLRAPPENLDDDDDDASVVTTSKVGSIGSIYKKQRHDDDDFQSDNDIDAPERFNFTTPTANNNHSQEV